MLTWQQRQGYSSHIQQPPYHQKAFGQRLTGPNVSNSCPNTAKGLGRVSPCSKTTHKHVSRDEVLTVHPWIFPPHCSSANQQVLWVSGRGGVRSSMRLCAGTSPGLLPPRSRFAACQVAIISLQEASNTWDTFYKYYTEHGANYTWSSPIYRCLHSPEVFKMNGEKVTSRSAAGTWADRSRRCTGTLNILWIKQFPAHKEHASKCRRISTHASCSKILSMHRKTEW